ncbi:uncharacterized protein [Physcomitrium patens]|uniref:uncharacterized protein isoform X5 n=1 Tax=Physcomitrium patens TaxID=3218 RepID=UPI000D163D9B|nr:uncharacterized protein LOC112291351 isoform X5 [Physcomitrium patens]|eukprot:XP_024394390.1 uncharacterized protein LOC112291351 isoform X5 [Physcomitrella patens]
MVEEPIAIWPLWALTAIVLMGSMALSREGPVSLVLDHFPNLVRLTVIHRQEHFILLSAGALALIYVVTQGQSRKLFMIPFILHKWRTTVHSAHSRKAKAGPNRDLCVFVCYIRYPQYPQDYASYPPNLFQYGAPQYPQMYGAPGAISPGSGPVYPYGSFTTQPLQGGPIYPGTQYGFQAPQVYGPAGAGLSPLTSAYGGSGTLPTSTPTGGVSPSLSAGQVAGQVSPQQYALPTGSQQQYSSGGGSEQQSG